MLSLRVTGSCRVVQARLILSLLHHAGARDLQQAPALAPETAKPIADLLFVLSAEKVRLACVDLDYLLPTTTNVMDQQFHRCTSNISMRQSTCMQASFPSTSTLQLKGVTSTVQFYGAGEHPDLPLLA